MPVPFTRFLLALAILLVGWLLYRLANRRILQRARSRSTGLERFRWGIPGILYFTAPGCLPCRTVQQPVLKELEELLGDRVQIVQVDAAQRPQLADHWGVLSVPTTFLIDTRRRPRRVNHGVARLDKLLSQLEEIAGPGFSALLTEKRVDLPTST